MRMDVLFSSSFGVFIPRSDHVGKESFLQVPVILALDVESFENMMNETSSPEPRLDVPQIVFM